MNIQPTIRMLDALANSESGLVNLDFLVRKVEKVLREPENLKLYDVNQQARLLRVFAKAQYLNVQHYPLVEALIRNLIAKIDTFQESDVITVLKAYHYLQTDVRMSHKLFSDLNATVVESAAQNKESVEVAFLVNYLHQFSLINQRVGAGRDLTKEQRELMVKLLEEKVAALGPQAFVPPNQLLALSRILLRTPKSPVLRDYLAAALRKLPRQLSFEELHAAMYAVQQAFRATGGEPAALKQVELEVLSLFKEGLA